MPDGTLGKHRIIASKTSNIILSEAKNIISPQGDASFDKCADWCYNIYRKGGDIMEPFEHLFDCILNRFNFIKNPIIKAIVQITAMAIFTAILVFIIIVISKLIISFIA